MPLLASRSARLASATAAILLAGLTPLALPAAEESVASPDGRIVVTVSDTSGLHYRVAFDGQPAIVDSRLGLDFAGGVSLGRAATIESATRADHDSTWENPFGQRRTVRDHYRELTVALREKSDAPSRLHVVVRAYDQGVALRYEIPNQPGLEEYTVTQEQTEFLFPTDLTCWAGNFSECAENQYPEKRLTTLDTNLGRPHVLPLLVKLPNGFAAIAESDLLDWAGMFVTAAGPDAQGAPRPGARVALAPRKDGRGLVHGRERRVSPWRTIQLA
ncbi:MAG: glycoside hydrolase family 97 N-terminal domain-containing protein, partial [Opitutaceae bacterium]|nr:glycoside hydrolase family 97 N-terminal domain-containing protein [Opitutaceae bacterium]